jgi:membrane protease YdiL (CAAX protease family)
VNALLPRSPGKFFWLAFYLLGFYAAWTSWALLLVRNPELNRLALLRAAVRLGLWVASALIFVRTVEGPPVLERLCFSPNLRTGWSIGAMGMAIVLVLFLAGHRFGSLRLRPPDAAAWLNPILTAPLAEEIVFRGVVFRILLERLKFWGAALASAVLFALIHAPFWWLSGDKRGLDLLSALGSMVGYGLLFAGLFRWSGSLWSPLLCHWFNNLLNTALVP